MCRGIRSGYGVFRFPEMVLLFLCLFFCEAFFASEALGFSSEDRRGRTASGVTVASSFADEEGDKGDALFELVLLKDKAEEGDPDAQFELGRRYLQGVGLERNDVMALHWVRKRGWHGCMRSVAGWCVMMCRRSTGTSVLPRTVIWWRNGCWASVMKRGWVRLWMPIAPVSGMKRRLSRGMSMPSPV